MNKNGTFSHDEQRVIDHLQGFKLSRVTDISKKTLNNHDATMLIVTQLGAIKVGVITAILKAWRPMSRVFQEPIWDKDFTTRVVKDVQLHPHYNYLFNTAIFGNYGYVAKHPMQPGNWMRYNCSYSQHNMGPMQPKPVNDKNIRDIFRRTYWYRVAWGTYAPTVEGMKRQKELFPNGIA
jgi:hypothetical protein